MAKNSFVAEVTFKRFQSYVLETVKFITDLENISPH